MSITTFSDHALKRCAQRGIKASAIETLLQFGSVRHRHGADVFFMDRKARYRASKELGRGAFAQIERYLNTYLVIADDLTIVTCGKRTKRMRSK
ncbi:DUF4258 domain-containing protein [Mesorhizobium sp. GR13]|uniref:DUF4258 domain-containing protein n=1 Tax=Mesorhizobium sp. GR13 TaxID=2562308 RepID=UPI0010C110A6|nr:DUF4258 domain-containing protein [Mesorhizobium sp. GR13]